MRTAILAAAALPAQRPPRRAWRAPVIAAAAAAAGAIGYLAMPAGSPSIAHTHGKLRPAPGARYVVTTVGRDEIVQLSEGALDVEVEPLHPGERFRVMVGASALEVRGTAFRVTADAERLVEVAVAHGRVDLTPDHGVPATLAAGQAWHAMPVARRALSPSAERDAAPVDSAPSGVDGAPSTADAGRAPSGVGREPSAIGRAPSTASRELSAVGREPSTASRAPSGVGREPSTASREPSTASRAPSGVGRVPSTAGREPSAVGRAPLTASRDLSAVGRVPSTVGREPSAVGRVPSTAAAGRAPSAAGREPSTVGRAPSTAAAGREQSAAGGAPSAAGREPLPSSRPAEEAAYDRAWAALRLGEFDRAVEGFARVVLVAPESPLVEDASFWRAVALARGKRSGEAVSAFRDFLDGFGRSPRAGQASAMLGWLQIDAAAFDDAARRFTAASADPDPKVRDSARAGLDALAKHKR